MFQKILTSCLLTLVAIGGFFVSPNINLVNKEITFNASVIYASNEMESQNEVYTAKSTPQSTAVKDMYNKLVAWLNIAMAVVTMLVSPAIMLAGWLMSPDWTSGDLFGLREVMYSLWVTISNITYFIYAVLLIFIALATIFGQENYGYKAMLPKLALGIILVPFTWWFVQWTISLATIVTASVITIPNEALESVVQWKGWWNSPVIPKKVVIDESSSIKWNAAAKAAEKCPDNCISPQQMISKSSGLYGHMLIYAYGVFKLNEIEKIENATDFVWWIIRLIHDGIISVIMLIVFWLLTLALIFMLLARAVMLWVYTIFSPFMTLELVMGGVMKNISKDFSIKEFIGLAFVPALVWLALSFGLVMVAAVQSPIRATASTACDVTKLKSAQGCQIISIMWNPENKISRKLVEANGKFTTVNEVKFGDVTYEFRWKIGWATDVDAEVSTANSAVSVIGSAGGVFGTVVVDIIALLFIWMAFMAAKGVSNVVDAAAKPFQDMGESIGKLGASLPKYTPIPGLGVSAKWARDLVGSVESKISANDTNKTQESWLGRMLGMNKMSSGETKAASANAVQAIGSWNLVDASKRFKDAVGAMQVDVKNQKTITEDVGKIAEALREQYNKNPDFVKRFADDNKIEYSKLKSYLDDTKNDPIKKDDAVKIQKFQELFLGKAGKWWTTGTSTTWDWIITKADLLTGTKDTYKISILNEPIQFKLDTTGKTITDISWLEALKDKKSWMTKDEFLKTLKSQSNLTDEAAKWIIDKLPSDFFK